MRRFNAKQEWSPTVKVLGLIFQIFFFGGLFLMALVTLTSLIWYYLP